MTENPVGAVMVVGDGIGSVQASLDLANAGFKVYLVAPHPILGGQMPKFDRSFPTNDCEICFLGPELLEVQRHPNIMILPQTDLLSLEGVPGNFLARLTYRPGDAPAHPGHIPSNKGSGHIEELPVGAVILAPAQQIFDPTVRRELGYGKYPNVVTSMDFDRILESAGPVAWIQCVGSRDRDHNYCSAVCCLEATKKAMMAKDYRPGTEHHIFMMDMRAFGKGYMDYYNRAREEYGIQYTRCRVASVVEDPATHELLLKYETESGELRTGRFALVVLSVGMEVSEEMKGLARRLGVELNADGFCWTAPFDPVQTSRPGVFVCGTFSQPRDTHDTVAQASAAASRAASLLAKARGLMAGGKQYPPERDISQEEPRIGVFISSLGIDNILDIPALEEYARTLPSVAHVEADRGLRPAAFRDRIREKVAELRLNRVVVASGTPLTYEALFRDTIREAGLNPYLLEMANIREQGAWAHYGEPQAATDKARDLIRMAVARARLLEPLHLTEIGLTHEALVIGGGVAGMNAALSIAEQGYRVCLVEREGELGGNLRHIHYDLDGKDVQAYLRKLVAAVESDPRITVLKGSTLLETSGSIGNFTSKVRTNGEVRLLRHGVTIVAVGGQEYRGGDYLLGQDPRVLTQRDLEQRIVAHDPALAAAKEIVMIQCVGPANQYCSRVCCSSALKNSLKIKEINPAANVYILYKDIRAYGFREKYYTEAREKGVIFLRYDDDNLPRVSADEALTVEIHDFLLDRDIRFRPDLLVLSEGIIPAEGATDLAAMLKVPLNAHGFFNEAHPKLRPADLAVEGLFLCGIAHSPKSIEESIAQAQAAAARAAAILAQEKLSIGGSIAVVDQSKCTGCLTCVRICPYDAPRINPQAVGIGNIIGAAEVDAALCRGCGSCAGECPAKAIQLLHYRDAQMLAQIEALWEAEYI